MYQAPAMHPGKLLGEVYTFTDVAAQPGVAYTYWLEVAWKDGSTTLLEPTTTLVNYRFFLPTIQR